MVESAVVVQGVVQVHESGEPVPGAAVSLTSLPSGPPGRGTRITDKDGRFLFRDVPPGPYRLLVTTPGFRRMSDTLQVSGEEDLDLLLPLSPDPIPLEAIIVRATRRPSPAMRGLEDRRRTTHGFVITREEIAERNPRLLSELLHRVPGGMVVPTPPHGYTLRLRGLCLPGIWLDGVRLPEVASIDQLLAPLDVEVVEVYHGFELPVEFGVNPCGGVLIWTRMGPRSETPIGPSPRGTIFSRLFLAASGLALVLFLIR